MTTGSSYELMQDGIRQVREGRQAEAYQLFKQVAAADPHNEFALIWISVTSPDLAEKRAVLEQALKLNPANQHAREAMRALEAEERRAGIQRARPPINTRTYLPYQAAASKSTDVPPFIPPAATRSHFDQDTAPRRIMPPDPVPQPAFQQPVLSQNPDQLQDPAAAADPEMAGISSTGGRKNRKKAPRAARVKKAGALAASRGGSRSFGRRLRVAALLLLFVAAALLSFMAYSQGNGLPWSSTEAGPGTPPATHESGQAGERLVPGEAGLPPGLTAAATGQTGINSQPTGSQNSPVANEPPPTTSNPVNPPSNQSGPGAKTTPAAAVQVAGPGVPGQSGTGVTGSSVPVQNNPAVTAAQSNPGASSGPAGLNSTPGHQAGVQITQSSSTGSSTGSSQTAAPNSPVQGVGSDNSGNPPVNAGTTLPHGTSAMPGGQSATGAPQNAQVALLLQKAQLSQAQGDYQGAIAACRNILQSDPRNVPANLMLGNIYMTAPVSALGQSVERYKEAARYFKAVTGEAPAWAGGFARLGEALAAQGSTPEAIAAISKSLELDPNGPERWLFLAGLYDKAGQAAQAKAARDKATALNEQFSNK